uniref:Uncharacterized protein n=1 Tax=Myotis myotis TaxID=51298 RepID=A0A7J7RCT4_MYOMY|nr:hypothetical protein mMyoMyo1_010830 [Myotis myotis]
MPSEHQDVLRKAQTFPLCPDSRRRLAMCPRAALTHSQPVWESQLMPLKQNKVRPWPADGRISPIEESAPGLFPGSLPGSVGQCHVLSGARPRWAGSRKPATQSHEVVRSFGPSNMEPGKFSQGITEGKEVSDCGPICSRSACQGLARPAWAQPSALQGGHRGHCEGRAISGPDARSVQVQDKHMVTTARKRDTKAQGKQGWCQRGGGRVHFCVKNGFNDM